LYVAGAGIHPCRTLPVMIDVGTDNVKLRNDPLYLGLQQPRLKGDEYFRLIGEFLDAVRERWPNALVQFEDFSTDIAHPMLHKYRHRFLCFNDDIQGTGAVTLAGVLAALRAQGRPASDICEQRIVCVGSGSAGLGVSFALSHAMQREGLAPHEAAQKFWMLDKDGLLVSGRAGLSYGQQQFARSDVAEPLGLLDVVSRVKPTILLGLSGSSGAIKEEVLREMAKHVERPIVFPVRFAARPRGMCRLTPVCS
jgi:malic enzyme